MTPNPLPRKSCSKSSITEGSDALVQVPSIRNGFLAHLYHPASNGMELATFPPDSAHLSPRVPAHRLPVTSLHVCQLRSWTTRFPLWELSLSV